jgi:hypothetical protein
VNASRRVVFSDVYGKRGVWRMPPENYRIIPFYDVPADLVPPATS